MYISRIWGEETPERIVSKFCLVIETQDVITRIKFGDDQLRGFWSARCQIRPFPLTLIVVLTTVLRYRVHCDKMLTYTPAGHVAKDNRSRLLCMEGGKGRTISHDNKHGDDPTTKRYITQIPVFEND